MRGSEGRLPLRPRAAAWLRPLGVVKPVTPAAPDEWRGGSGSSRLCGLAAQGPGPLRWAGGSPCVGRRRRDVGRRRRSRDQAQGSYGTPDSTAMKPAAFCPDLRLAWSLGPGNNARTRQRPVNLGRPPVLSRDQSPVLGRGPWSACLKLTSGSAGFPGLGAAAPAPASGLSARADPRRAVHSSGDGGLRLAQRSIPFQNTLKSVVKYLSCLKYLRNL